MILWDWKTYSIQSSWTCRLRGRGKKRRKKSL